MGCDGYTKVWELPAGELIRLDDASGTTLRVTRGTLWLTLEGDTRDVVLTAGDSFMIDRAGLTLVQAQDDAVVCVLGRHVDEARVRAGRPRIGARIAAWFAAVDVAAIDPRRAPYF
jgi:hypothetical protein